MARSPGGIAASVVVLLSGLVTASAVTVGLSSARESRRRVACADNLRALGAAALQYGDEQRFLPYAGDRTGPSGGVESTASIRITRTLVERGLLEAGRAQVCPSSADEVPAGGSTWLVDARPASVRLASSPMAERAGDPTLAEARDLSYGWTRRRMATNCRCLSPLAADRAVRPPGGSADPGGDPLQGDHVGGLSVLTTDGSVRWTPSGEETADLLDDHGRAGLGIADPDRPRPARPWPARAFDPAAEWLLVPVGLAGLALLLRAGPAPPPPARGLVPVRPSAVVTLGARPDLAATSGLDLRLHPDQRCPWCHAGLAPAQPLTVCPGCRTAFHAECAPPGAACTTLGCASRAT